MPANTVVANTSAALSGKTLATTEDALQFLGVLTVAPVSPPDNSAWLLVVVGPPNGVQLWVNYLTGPAQSIELGTLT